MEEILQFVGGLDWKQLAALAAVGICGGVLSGLVGVGGGIVFVPGLVYVLGWDIRDAVAASLVIVVFSSLSGTIRNHSSSDPTDWRTTAILASAVAPATLIGVYISTISSETVVRIAFASVLLALAYPTARGRPDLEGARRIPRALVVVAGVFIGALSGLVGVGGGVVMVPLMVLGMGLKTKQAISTSLAVVLFAALVGAGGYLVAGFDSLLALPPLIVGSMIGAWLGVNVRDAMPDRAVRIIFALFMVAVALNLLAGAADIL